MKVSMELNVSDKEFYDLMMKSLKEEVKNVTKKNLELKEGLKYKKKSAQRKGIGSEITVHIKRLIPNTLYEATFVTAIDHTTISYKIESLNESKIKVTYEEIYEIFLQRKFLFGDKKWQKNSRLKNQRKCLKRLKSLF